MHWRLLVPVAVVYAAFVSLLSHWAGIGLPWWWIISVFVGGFVIGWNIKRA